MDLREFIVETLYGIVGATSDLQQKFGQGGAIVNPPINAGNRDLYEDGQRHATKRRIELVEFDVALTVGTESGGKGNVGLKVFGVAVGVDGERSQTSAQVSRVKFSIPLVLPPSSVEGRNLEAGRTAETDARANRESRSDDF